MRRGKGIPKKSRVRKLIRYFVALLLGFLLIHSIFNLVCSYKLARALREAKSSGIELELSGIIPPAIAAEENAATLYQEAFALIQELEKRYRTEHGKSICDGNLLPLEKLVKENKALRELILGDPDFIRLYNLVEKAVNLPCRFDVNYEDGCGILLPHYPNMRQLARLVAARTCILVEQKKYSEALESAQVSFRLGDAFNDEPFLISQLVRMHVDGIAMESFEGILTASDGDIPIEGYRELIKEIENKKGITKGLEGEVVLVVGDLFKKTLEGRVRVKRVPPPEGLGLFVGLDATLLIEDENEGKMIEMLAFYDPAETLYWRAYTSYLARPIVKKDYTFYIRRMTQAIHLCDLPYHEASENLDRLDQGLKGVFWWTHPVSGMFLPSIKRLAQRQASCLARFGGFKLALALQIYKAETGAYPQKPSDLLPNIIPELPLDPFTGKEYIYRRVGEGFIVYSVGENIVDDGGIEKDKSGEPDIVWECEN